MSPSDRSNEFLLKTYCYLINVVLPQANQNQADFPPAEMWVGVIAAIINAIKEIEKELRNRGIDPNGIDCSQF